MKFRAALTKLGGMQIVEILIDFELDDDVGDASKYSLAAQIADVIERAIEEKELELPDGDIIDFEVLYDPELHF